uniref:DUF2344 domain-containing protein n=1 Tax=Eisenbergiella sp. TaxID=1924109 RepID=UPI003AB2B749
RPGKEPCGNWQEKLADFLAQKEITVTKKTKRSEKTVDIRPFIYQMEACDSGVFMQLASASSNYTKPELVMDTFVRWLDKEPQEFAYMIERREVYADAGEDKNPRFLPLEALGDKVESANHHRTEALGLLLHCVRCRRKSEDHGAEA